MNFVLFVSRVNWEDELHSSINANKSNIHGNLSTPHEPSTIAISQDQIMQGNETIAENMDFIWEERRKYIYYYSFSMLIVLYLVFQRSFAFFHMCLKASRNLHDKLFRGITRATMYFFNTNPSGRILNRFSKDIGSIDTTLPVALMDCLLVSREQIQFFFLRVRWIDDWLFETFFLSQKAKCRASKMFEYKIVFRMSAFQWIRCYNDKSMINFDVLYNY